ncbi:MAG: PD40 domain-containing protein [Planctomycetes bacterium]|nr:PD40 domain-containing protein [Planctomycetota bacterium]
MTASSICWLLGAYLLAGPAAGADPKTGAIVFSSDRSGDWRIWTIGADGTGLRALTKGEDGQNDVDPVWSPDATSILFTSTRGGKPGIWRASASGTDLERICDGDQAEWSPDGKRIAFRRSEKIVTRDLAGGAEKIISPENFPHCSGPAWSPDGKTIAFACRWEAGNAIFVIDATGGEPRKVYDRKGACEPHWSPDGKRLVYETETHIASIGADGTGNRPVTYYGGIQRYGRYGPGGKEIVFCQGASPRGPWELYIVAAEGGTPRRLTEGGSDMYPDWK